MKKVLIIEDDKGIAELERDYLEANGFEVQMAFTGLSGKKAALSSPVDLILLDIMLPGEDGFQVCREIRAEKDIPILMVSARQEDIDKIRGLGLGADDYIVKPFSPTELVARVKSHISRYEQLTNRESSRPQVLRCGNLVIDLSSHQVFLQDKEILLPNKEFELLAFLAKNPASYSARIRSLSGYGAKIPWVIPLLSPFISIESGKRLRRIHQTVLY